MKTISALTLRELPRADLEQAALVLGRGMCDNPTDVRAFVALDAERRRRALARFFRPVLLGLHQRGLVYGAYRDDSLVGVCGIARPGFCQPAIWEKLRVAPSVVFGNSIATTLRVLKWTSEWSHRDLARAHWHLGPLAVDPCVQGQGIGSAMLNAFCAHMDAYSSFAYLETDRFENVRFYQRFGFTVVAEARVLGVHTWFMSRPGLDKHQRKPDNLIERQSPSPGRAGFSGGGDL
jgi:ribosomal protein S18 acetylase RimI-like enzyme